jgi:hypothetical protein
VRHSLREWRRLAFHSQVVTQAVRSAALSKLRAKQARVARPVAEA